MGFAPDLKFALRVLNGRDTCDVGFPEAFRVRILTDIYTSIIEAHRGVTGEVVCFA